MIFLFLLILAVVFFLSYLIVFLIDRRRAVAFSWALVAVALTTVGILLVTLL